MARFIREIPQEVAKQALTNKTLNAKDLHDAAEGDDPGVEAVDLILLATDVAAPELLPYEYAYTDVYTDGGGAFYAAINERFYRRSTQKTIDPAG